MGGEAVDGGAGEEVVVPEPTLPTSSDEEVLIDIFSPLPILTVALARLLLLLLLLLLILRPQQ